MESSSPNGSDSPLNSTEVHDVGDHATESSQQPEPSAKKVPAKRNSKTKSIVWDHCEKVFDDKGVVVAGICNYCKNKYVAGSKQSGTSTLLTHLKKCMQHPVAIDKRLAEKSLVKIREACKFVRSSPARLIKFRQICDLVNCQETCALCLDVQTRWNSTYLMLSSAIKYRRVFEELEGNDTYVSDMGVHIPTFGDWQFAECFVKLLKSFYDMTLRISGSLYVTSNTFFIEVSDLNCTLDDMIGSKNDIEKAMGTQMKAKFLKYWGNPDKMNHIIFFAKIMDPREKIEFMGYEFENLYGE